MCSRGSGRGGMVYIDCVVQPSTPTPLLALPLYLASVRFSLNDAMSGRDLFIRCHSIDAQIHEDLFSIDFNTAFDKNNAFKGRDVGMTVSSPDVDLILLVDVYRSDEVFASSVSDDAIDNRQCGPEASPCRSLSYAVDHVFSGRRSTLYAMSTAPVEKEMKVTGMSVTSSSRTQATIVFNSTIAQSGSVSAIVTTVSTVIFDLITVTAGHSLESSHTALISSGCGTLRFTRCSFECEGDTQVNCTMVSVVGGELVMNTVSFTSVDTTASLVTLSGCESFLMEKSATKDVQTGKDVIFGEGKTGSVVISNITVSGLTITDGSVIGHRTTTSNDNADGVISISSATINGVARENEGGCVISYGSGVRWSLKDCAMTNYSS